MAAKATALLNAPVTAASAESSSCKCVQVLYCLLAGRSFGRCRKADQEWTLEPSALGVRLRKLAGKMAASCCGAHAAVRALSCNMHPR